MKDEIIDLLKTVKVLYKIENSEHPTISVGDEKYADFKDWFENKYIKSGLIDEIIDNLE